MMLSWKEASLGIVIARIMADTHVTQENASTTHAFGRLSRDVGAFRSGVSGLWGNYFM